LHNSITLALLFVLLIWIISKKIKWRLLKNIITQAISDSKQYNSIHSSNKLYCLPYIHTCGTDTIIFFLCHVKCPYFPQCKKQRNMVLNKYNWNHCVWDQLYRIWWETTIFINVPRTHPQESKKKMEAEIKFSKFLWVIHPQEFISQFWWNVTLKCSLLFRNYTSIFHKTTFATRTFQGKSTEILYIIFACITYTSLNLLISIFRQEISGKNENITFLTPSLRYKLFVK
jgi:hypothetical protein